MKFNFIRKNNVSPIMFLKKPFRPSIKLDVGRCNRRLLVLLLLMSAVFVLTSPLAAQEPEKLTVSPAGSASWSDHLTFQQQRPAYGKEARVVPFMPKPDRR